MCGRYVLRRIDLHRYGVSSTLLPDFEEFSEKVTRQGGLFKIAPSQYLPVIRLDKEGNRVASLVKWGLIPSWTKGKPKLQPINAKSETAATSGMSPTRKKMLETVRYVLTANTSHSSGERMLVHSCRWFGYGNSQ